MLQLSSDTSHLRQLRGGACQAVFDVIQLPLQLLHDVHAGGVAWRNRPFERGAGKTLPCLPAGKILQEHWGGCRVLAQEPDSEGLQHKL